eukprot:3999570-Lingulodinium_polyedra.AAC.1
MAAPVPVPTPETLPPTGLADWKMGEAAPTEPDTQCSQASASQADSAGPPQGPGSSCSGAAGGPAAGAGTAETSSGLPGSSG